MGRDADIVVGAGASMLRMYRNEETRCVLKMSSCAEHDNRHKQATSPTTIPKLSWVERESTSVQCKLDVPKLNSTFTMRCICDNHHRSFSYAMHNHKHARIIIFRANYDGHNFKRNCIANCVGNIHPFHLFRHNNIRPWQMPVTNTIKLLYMKQWNDFWTNFLDLCHWACLTTFVYESIYFVRFFVCTRVFYDCPFWNSQGQVLILTISFSLLYPIWLPSDRVNFEKSLEQLNREL